MSSLYAYFRISKPRAEKVPAAEVEGTYRRLRSRTFWGVTVAYTLYYVCRMTLGVVKQPLIDGGVLTAGQLGIIGSAFYFVYAVGKFMNGFIADYCNIRRFMAVGIGISALVNLLLGLMGLWSWPAGVLLVAFSILGLVLRCVNAKRLSFAPAERELPRETRFKTVWCNAGMILFAVLCLGTIISSILL